MKENTKNRLDKHEKLAIISYIVLAITYVCMTVITKNSAYIICSILWIQLALFEYLNMKILKLKDRLINYQDKIILELMKNLNEVETNETDN